MIKHCISALWRTGTGRRHTQDILLDWREQHSHTQILGSPSESLVHRSQEGGNQSREIQAVIPVFWEHACVALKRDLGPADPENSEIRLSAMVSIVIWGRIFTGSPWGVSFYLYNCNYEAVWWSLGRTWGCQGWLCWNYFFTVRIPYCFFFLVWAWSNVCIIRSPVS